MSWKPEDFYCNFQLYINGQFEDEADTPKEIWELIGEYPFGSLYEVGSAKGLDVSEFIPY